MADSKSVEPKTETVPVPPKKSSNKTLWIVLGVVLFFVVIVPVILFAAAAIWFRNNASEQGAEKLVEGIVEQTTGSNVDINSADGSFSVESEDGSSSFSAGSDQKLPDDFPKEEVPYLGEEKVTFVLTSTNEGKKTWSVTTTVSDTYEDAKAFFEKAIAEPDYQDVSAYGFSDSQTYYGADANYSVNVTVSKPTSGEDGTNVTYIITQK
jgi:cytoskeletal protein RodZ